jgi:hypothetical protein
MENYLNFKGLCLSGILVLSLYACSKDDSNPETKNDPDPVVIVSLEDTISRKWMVDVATHNGTSDGSSKGLIVDMRKDGSYTLVSTNYIGTWEFLDNKTKVLLDKGVSNLETTWTIGKITSKSLIVDFKSPFTGGNAHWEMISF